MLEEGTPHARRTSYALASPLRDLDETTASEAAGDEASEPEEVHRFSDVHLSWRALALAVTIQLQ